jgi:hypothetical protein
MVCLGCSDTPFLSDASNLIHKDKSSARLAPPAPLAPARMPPHTPLAPASAPRSASATCSYLCSSLRTRRSLPPTPRALARADSPRAAVVDQGRRSAGPCHRLRRQALQPRRPCPSTPPSSSRSAQVGLPANSTTPRRLHLAGCCHLLSRLPPPRQFAAPSAPCCAKKTCVANIYFRCFKCFRVML